jgi:nucleoside-diphosphate-sugar epimerase
VATTGATPTVLITGGSGFIAGAVLTRLLKDGWSTRVSLRESASEFPSHVRIHGGLRLESPAGWDAAVRGCDAVVHTAARVHVMSDTAANPLDEYRRVNVTGSAEIARMAAAAGVRRFVFLSSIKVNGERTIPGQPFTASDPPRPEDPYGVSKLEAEELLRRLGQRTGMEIVIIRPVLVYGPGVKGNFRSMMRWLNRGVPLPLGAIDNRRSLVGVDNLADLIVTCLTNSAAANQTFLLSDGEDLSTPELLKRTALALGKSARLLPVPPGLLRRAALFTGKRAVVERLVGRLQVDITQARTQLNWTPPFTVDDQLSRTATEFLRSQRQ